MPNLTPKNAEFLSYMAVLPDRTCSVSSLHARFSEEVAEHEIDQLYSKHLIDTAAYAPYDGFSINHPTSYYVTMDGVAALADHLLASKNDISQRAEQNRKEKEQSANDNEAKKQKLRHDFLVASVGAAVGSVITGLIDHFAEICMFFKQLIR